MRHAYAILRRLGIVEYKQEDDEFLCYCLFCGDEKYNLQINFQKRLWHCWVCDEGGSLFGLIYRITGLDRATATALFRLDEIDVKKTLQETIDILQKDKQRKYNYKKFKTKDRYELWAKRGINRSSVKKFQLGYDTYTSRLVIPLFNTIQHCVGLSRRATRDDQAPKYLNSSSFNKKNFLFGYNNIEMNAEYIVLTEGPMDCIVSRQYGLNSVAMLGDSMAKPNYDRIAEDFDHIALMLDNDTAGELAAGKIAGRFMDMGKKVYIVGYKTKDPGDLTSANQVTELKPLSIFDYF